jgi:hypothetical protein
MQKNGLQVTAAKRSVAMRVLNVSRIVGAYGQLAFVVGGTLERQVIEAMVTSG